jgi:hypothetical protein
MDNLHIRRFCLRANDDAPWARLASHPQCSDPPDAGDAHRGRFQFRCQFRLAEFQFVANIFDCSSPLRESGSNLVSHGVTHHMQPLYLNPQRVGVVGVNSAQIAEDLIATPS